MELIPALDILDGKAVRLKRGRYDQVTVYDDDPLARARLFEAQGATRLHVVDLEGARQGRPVHLELVRSMVEQTSLAIQVGGGIRDAKSAEHWLAIGADRVVLGTAVVHRPREVEALCKAFPGKIVLALDARGQQVAVEGWEKDSGLQLSELAREVDRWSPAAVLFTAIERDGTEEGPDVSATLALQALLRAPVIASGGIGGLEHVRRLAQAGVRAAVCGRALYEGAFELVQAFAVARGEEDAGA